MRESLMNGSHRSPLPVPRGCECSRLEPTGYCTPGDGEAKPCGAWLLGEQASADPGPSRSTPNPRRHLAFGLGKVAPCTWDGEKETIQRLSNSYGVSRVPTYAAHQQSTPQWLTRLLLTSRTAGEHRCNFAADLKRWTGFRQSGTDPYPCCINHGPQSAAACRCEDEVSPNASLPQIATRIHVMPCNIM